MMHITERLGRLPAAALAIAALAVAASLAAVQGHGAAAVRLPPLAAAAASEHHPGKLIWVDLVTPDLAAAEHFYGELFGWRFEASAGDAATYAVGRVDGRPLCGILQRAVPSGEHRQSAWLPFFAVVDADKANALALKAGATSLVRPRTYRERGRQAVLRDPQGAPFGVLASSAGDPPDVLAEPG